MPNQYERRAAEFELLMRELSCLVAQATGNTDMSGDPTQPPPINLMMQVTEILLLRTEYFVRKNPFFAWSAYLKCVQNGFRIPEWLHTYLTEAANSLCTLEYEPKAFHQSVSEAIGVANAGHSRDFRKFERDRQIARAVCSEINYGWSEKPRVKMDVIFETVAKRLGCSKSKARQCYLRLLDSAHQGCGLSWDTDDDSQSSSSFSTVLIYEKQK